MRAPVSIIIPTLNAADQLPMTLAHLGEGLEAGLIRELILSDGGSTDDTSQIADTAGATLIKGAPGRGGQLRRGAQAAKGAWLMFLHADTQLSEGWAKTVLDHIQTQPDKAGYFRLAFRAKGLGAGGVAAWANLRSRLFGLPYGDQALLISRQLYDETGGFENIPLMEDVAMARALRGYLVAMDGTAHTSAARYETQGWLRRGARNLWTLTRYLCGVDPEKLARQYYKK